MGWITRGTGRNYDSIKGFGAGTGNLRSMVLDYSTYNRKCKQCGESGKFPEHECWKNLYGSTKAMEPHVPKDFLWIAPFFNLKMFQLEF
jgi:hypothetical protein